MAKRFIDTGLFDDNWFMDLSKDSKLLYLYVITKCSHAGLIELNDRLCKFQTGITNLKGAIKGLGNRLVTVNEGFFFAPKFLFFQYPNFPNSKVFQQKTALEELTRLGLFKDGKLTPLEGFPNPYDNDSVDVDDSADDNVNADADVREVVIFPFETIEFKKWWDLWKEYKFKDHKFKYKSNISEQAALKKLSELSGADESIAIKIIEQSMAQGWVGFFELKKNNQITASSIANDLEEIRKKKEAGFYKR